MTTDATVDLAKVVVGLTKFVKTLNAQVAFLVCELPLDRKAAFLEEFAKGDPDANP